MSSFWQNKRSSIAGIPNNEDIYCGPIDTFLFTTVFIMNSSLKGNFLLKLQIASLIQALIPFYWKHLLLSLEITWFGVVPSII
jgi:hypothetical protein